jgi:hypothetical protein
MMMGDRTKAFESLLFTFLKAYFLEQPRPDPWEWGVRTYFFDNNGKLSEKAVYQGLKDARHLGKLLYPVGCYFHLFSPSLPSSYTVYSLGIQ